jgi:SH3-like domain-containing protein
VKPIFSRAEWQRSVVTYASTAVILCAVSCGTSTSPAGDELGEAFVAPATLTLRREIVSKSGNVTVLKHGERVSIIDIKRRFVKVRTAKHLEGWVDSSQLLSSEQMAQIAKEAKAAATLPSQGAATVFEPLNVHVEPFRQSPAFARIEEGSYVSVLAHKLTSRTAEPPRPPSLVKERPQPERRRKKKGAKNLNLPAPPPPPKAPENWEELSTERSGRGESPADAKKRRDQEAAGRKAAEAQKPVQYEDWTLVRTKDNQIGWVLSRNLAMGIPDEVAQFAEGKRITSYFDLGTINDEEKGVKHNWLWTTASKQISCDFDAWRVFLWNRKRHRYETSFRQRDIEGYYPVRVDPPDPAVFGRAFHLLFKDEDGKFRLRNYVFDSVRVHLTATEDALPNGQAITAPSAKALDTGKIEEKKSALRGWFSRAWQGLSSRFRSRSSTP